VPNPVTLKYIYAGTTYLQTYTVLSVRGIDDFDEIQFYPAYRNDYLDGTLDDPQKVFRRVITIGFGVVQDAGTRRFLERWQNFPQRSIIYGAQEIIVDPFDASFSNTWQNNVKLGRYFVIRCIEATPISVQPSPIPAIADSLMYIKKKVQVTGTESSPQTFTTTVAPLDTDDAGHAFPAISLLSFAPTVLITSLQTCLVSRTTDTITQSGANITFKLFHDNVGNPSGDGNFYADVTIGLEAL